MACTPLQRRTFLVLRRFTAASSNLPVTLITAASYSSSSGEVREIENVMPLGTKAKENRFKRNSTLRRNRRDAFLEKKARTGHCESQCVCVYIHATVLLLTQIA